MVSSLNTIGNICLLCLVCSSEYKEHIKRDGIKKAFEDYIMSVPSIFRIHIADCDIRYLLRSWSSMRMMMRYTSCIRGS